MVNREMRVSDNTCIDHKHQGVGYMYRMCLNWLPYLTHAANVWLYFKSNLFKLLYRIYSHPPIMWFLAHNKVKMFPIETPRIHHPSLLDIVFRIQPQQDSCSCFPHPTTNLLQFFGGRGWQIWKVFALVFKIVPSNIRYEHFVLGKCMRACVLRQYWMM